MTGWDDSKIRAFYPETGRLMYTVQNAHKKGVTAVCTTSTCDRIISGGGEGQVRVWDIKEVRPSNNHLYGNRHKRTTDKAAGDGSAGIPESTFASVLVAAMYEHTNAVSCIQISKDDKSCVSASADSTCIIWCLQKIGYWEVYDGSMIRQLDGSRSGSINGMDITTDGDTFVTGGNDKLVKVRYVYEY
ncbi:unnamed protein product [Trichobilharzia regenti]|nr:unnamed protein product [Trichobilharzia regenti]